MKKVLALLLAAVMLLSFTACGDNDSKKDKDNNKGGNQTVANDAEAIAEAAILATQMEDYRAMIDLCFFDYAGHLKKGALEEFDSESEFFEMMGTQYDTTIKSWDDVFTAVYNAAKKSCAEYYGKDYKTSTKVIRSRDLTKDKLAELTAEWATEYGGFYDAAKLAAVTEAKEITVKATIKGSEGEDSVNFIAIVIKYDGQWKAADYDYADDGEDDEDADNGDDNDADADKDDDDNNTTVIPNQPSGGDNPVAGTKVPNVGTIQGGYYINEWADLKVKIPANFQNVTANYQTGSAEEDCCLYVQDMTNGTVVEIFYNKKTMSEGEFLQAVAADVQTSLKAQNIELTFSDIVNDAEVGPHEGAGVVANMTYPGGTTGSLLLFAYEQDNYIISLTVIALSEDALSDVMMGFTAAK